MLLENEEEGSLPSMFVEDTSMSNLKLVVGFSAVGASLVSHVYPAPFPRNWMCLLLCCAYYFVMSGVLQLLLSYVELESILLLKAKRRDDSAKPAVRGLNISSNFPRFQNIYTLGLTPMSGSAVMTMASSPKFMPEEKNGNPAAFCAQRSWPVELYFDEEGTFLEEEFMTSVSDFVDSYVATLRGGSKKDQ